MRQLLDVAVYFVELFQFTHPGRGATANSEGIEIKSITFQFTHPGRGATREAVDTPDAKARVSIHAPREGCDSIIVAKVWRAQCFNSRTPGGVRLARLYNGWREAKFQFTHPGRGATKDGREDRRRLRVSIHAPREGCDRLLAS